MSSLPPQLPDDVLIVGMGVTGWALAEALVRRGATVQFADDRPEAVGGAPEGLERLAVADCSDLRTLRSLVERAAAVAPSPGVSTHHPVYALADELGCAVTGDFDVAAAIDHRPTVAVTGTNGKTTVVTLVERMLCASGQRAVAAGNTDLPLVAAVDRHPDATVFVVEASSFRLARALHFTPTVAAWLNLAPDHLDHHGTFDHYAASKARIFANAGPHTTAVIPADDPHVTLVAERSGAHLVTFSGTEGAAGDARVDGGCLTLGSRQLVSVRDLPRRAPHDLANAAAATAIASSSGADETAIVSTLTGFDGLPHRVQHVGTIDGVRFYNDSKATTPHATVAALNGFSGAVLIAGGRNKLAGLEALSEASPHIAAVVAIGEAAADVDGALGHLVPTQRASAMSEAVQLAFCAARATGASVLLSPACASFDAYGSYGERGDHFTSCVAQLAEKVDAEARPR